jgi:hypothetical protein
MNRQEEEEEEEEEGSEAIEIRWASKGEGVLLV